MVSVLNESEFDSMVQIIGDGFRPETMKDEGEMKKQM